MPKTVYILNSFSEIDDLQKRIMLFIDDYTHNKENRRRPIPHKEVLIGMKKQKVVESTTTNALIALQKKGYIRRAETISNTTSYVQLRRV